MLALARAASRLPRGGRHIVKLFRLHEVMLDTFAGPVCCDLSESVCYPLLKYGTYPHAQAEFDWMRHTAGPGDLVLDIGANVGFTAMLFASTGATVVAFEPSPRAFRLLQRTAEGRFEARNMAVSDRVGSVRFAEQERLDLSCVSARGPIEVRAATVDSLDLRPTIIKIDVEGHEAAVLAGAKHTLGYGPTILFEALTEAALAECTARIVDANPRYRVRRLQDNNHLAEVSGDEPVALPATRRSEEPRWALERAC